MQRRIRLLKPTLCRIEARHPAMTDDNLLSFSFPAVQRRKITAAFDGGRISSDGGVMLLAQADRRLGIADRLARVIPDGRDQDRVTHLLPDILRARISPSPAAMKTPTTSTGCAPIRPSSWLAGGYPTAVPICARSRPSRAGRTHPPCAI
jgi:hypothetical protein